jgi:hypothetical protein
MSSKGQAGVRGDTVRERERGRAKRRLVVGSAELVGGDDAVGLSELLELRVCFRVIGIPKTSRVRETGH